MKIFIDTETGAGKIEGNLIEVDIEILYEILHKLIDMKFTQQEVEKEIQEKINQGKLEKYQSNGYMLKNIPFE